jgi:microcompartment protein CcmL/EutN
MVRLPGRPDPVFHNLSGKYVVIVAGNTGDVTAAMATGEKR